MNKKLLILGLLSLSLFIMIFSCVPDELSGNVVDNQQPRIGVTNIEYNDSVFTFNAVINWYGTDEDGQVIYYYYIVMLCDSVGDDPDTYVDTRFSEIDISEWTQTEETEATIDMLAGESETDTLCQYVFFMCEDDAGAYSNIDYYKLHRVNRLPQSYIDEFPGMGTKSNGDLYVLPSWSLADTNALWEGLIFSWSGDDTLDFPDGAPDFEYKWELYGPYDKSYYSFDDSTVRELTLDSISTEKMAIQSCDDNSKGYIRIEDDDNTTCSERWVWDTETVITDLRTGCYIFVLTTRDDALVPDPTPSWNTFFIIEPYWLTEPDSTKDILIIQATQYADELASLGRFHGYPPDSITLGDTPTYFPPIIQDYYSDKIQTANSNLTFDFYGEPAVGSYGNATADFPDLITIAHYRMVLVDDMDYHKIELNEGDFVDLLESYLGIGGKAWVIGRQSFSPSGATVSGYKDYNTSSLAVDYFDLSAAYYTTFNLFDSLDNNWENGEFVSATSVYSGYNSLDYDSVKTQYLLQDGIHKVEALILNSVNSTALFTYVAAVPDTMADFQYRPVATRYFPDNEVYKTSYFSFPLYLMDDSNGDVQAVFDDMLDWFLNDE